MEPRNEESIKPGKIDDSNKNNRKYFPFFANKFFESVCPFLNLLNYCGSCIPYLKILTYFISHIDIYDCDNEPETVYKAQI